MFVFLLTCAEWRYKSLNQTCAHYIHMGVDTSQRYIVVGSPHWLCAYWRIHGFPRISISERCSKGLRIGSDLLICSFCNRLLVRHIVLGSGPPAGHSKCMGIHAHLAVTSKVLRPLPQGRLGWAVGVHSPSSRLPSSSSPVNTMYQHHVPTGVIRIRLFNDFV